MELIVNVLDMRADRLELNAGGFGDLLILVASGEQSQDFLLSLRQILEVRPSRRAVLEETDQLCAMGIDIGAPPASTCSTACTNSVRSAFFKIYPLAPARSESKMSSRSSYVVSINTLRFAITDLSRATH